MPKVSRQCNLVVLLSRAGGDKLTCPSGYLITYPTTTLDSKRPAYGGTCYKQWPAGSSAFVVAYNSASLASTMLITSQSFPGFANYAHVIDGVLAASTSQTPSSTSSSTSHLSSPPQSVFPAASVSRRFCSEVDHALMCTLLMDGTGTICTVGAKATTGRRYRRNRSGRCGSCRPSSYRRLPVVPASSEVDDSTTHSASEG